VILDSVALACAAVPALTLLANLPLFRTPAPAAAPPPVSVLIPARNEAANIEAACGAVLASRGVELELVVLDDHSEDGTGRIVRAISDRRVRLASAPPLPAGWVGKQHACACLARLARNDLMVFIDADVRLAPDALARIAGFMQRGNVALGSGFPAEITGSWAEGLLLPLIHFLLLGFLPLPVARRSKAVAFGAGCGQLMAAWRDPYQRVGGHGAVPMTLHDGITLPRAFRRAGLMTGVFDASRIARCRMYDSAPALFAGLAKNATEGMARPVALPVWTALLGCGQILPVVLVAIAPGPLSVAALSLGISARLLLAARFGQSVWSALLHPLGVAMLLGVQWWALARAALGRPAVWRGRSYARDGEVIERRDTPA
jgi:Glycosyl transferase family 2